MYNCNMFRYTSSSPNKSAETQKTKPNKLKSRATAFGQHYRYVVCFEQRCLQEQPDCHTDKHKLVMVMLRIHTICIGTENKRPDGKPFPPVHNFKTDFKIHRKSRRLSSSAGSGQGLVAESCRYTGKEFRDESGQGQGILSLTHPCTPDIAAHPAFPGIRRPGRSVVHSSPIYHRS